MKRIRYLIPTGRGYLLADREVEDAHRPQKGDLVSDHAPGHTWHRTVELVMDEDETGGVLVKSVHLSEADTEGKEVADGVHMDGWRVTEGLDHRAEPFKPWSPTVPIGTVACA